MNKKVGYSTTSNNKKEVLTTLASIYDPLGMLTPVKINMKIYMQNLWEKGLDWDNKLDDKDRDLEKNESRYT